MPNNLAFRNKHIVARECCTSCSQLKCGKNKKDITKENQCTNS